MSIHQGDSILAEFPSVVDAVNCALEIHGALKVENQQLTDEQQMKFRIGINLGDVIEDEGCIYGDGVNIAARIESMAEPGGICISGTVHNHISGKIAIQDEFLGEHKVKNIEKPVPVYRIPMEPELVSPGVKQKRDDRRRLWLASLVLFAIVTLIFTTFWLVNTIFNQDRAEDTIRSNELSQNEAVEKPSIAVLPFENMSGDSEEEYFSDGISVMSTNLSTSKHQNKQ